MKKAVIIGGVIVLLFVLAFAGLAVFAKSYLTDERIRQLVLPRIEKAINRKVSLGTLKVSIFSGISLEDLTVSDREGKGIFIKGDRLVLRYKLLPLLRKQLVVDSVELVSPRVNIKRDLAGRFNYEDIVAGKKPEKKGGKEEPSGGGLALLVKSIRVRDAELTLVDESDGLPEVRALAGAEIGLSSDPSRGVSLSGSVDLKKVSLSYQGLTPLIKGKIRFSDRDIDLDMRLSLLNNDLSVKGTISDYRGKPSLSIDLNAERIDADSLAASFGKISGKKKKGAPARKKGAPRSQPPLPDMKGSLRLGEVQFKGTKIGPVRISYRVGGSKASLSGNVTIEGNKTDIKADLKNYPSNPDLSFEITSDDLNLDPLLEKLPEKEGDEKSSKEQTQSPEKKLKPLPLPANFTFSGNMKAGRLQVNKAVISDFIAEAALSKGIFRLKRFSGKISGGEFSVTSRADLRDPALPYSKKIRVEDVDIHELMKAFQPKVADMIFGKGNISLDFDGKGRTPGLIKKTLGGKGSFLLRDGKFTGTELTKKLALFLGLPELETIPFDVSEGTLKINKGIIRLKSSVSSPDISMDPHGSINLPSDRLSIKMEMTFSEKLTLKLKEQAKFAKYLVGESRQASLPLKISGRLSSPKYGLDTEALAGKVKEKVEKRVTGEIMKKLSGGDKKKGDEEEKKKAPVGDMLKGIFGK